MDGANLKYLDPALTGFLTYISGILYYRSQRVDRYIINYNTVTEDKLFPIKTDLSLFNIFYVYSTIKSFDYLMNNPQDNYTGTRAIGFLARKYAIDNYQYWKDYYRIHP